LFAGAGALQPTYLVTADDVDSLLAVEVQPLDDRKRKVYNMCWPFLNGTFFSSIHFFLDSITTTTFAFWILDI
jgi:hypothetical protein